MSVSTVYASSPGADGLLLALKVAVGFSIFLKIDFVSPPSFKFDMTYIETFSRKDSKEGAFFLNFSYLRPRTTPTSGMFPSKVFGSVCCRLLP